MKRICALSIVVVFFLLGGLHAFAAGTDPENPAIINTTQNSTIVIEYYYNPYGVAISSKTTTTTTTRTEREGGGWEESTTVSVQRSTWKGGSLKIDSVTGTTHTESSDGAYSKTKFWINYEYNSDGQLVSASGGSHSKGNLGVDSNGDPLGTFASDTVNNYIIRNGQALVSSSVTTGREWSHDGTLTVESTTTTNNAYELMGGSWVLMSSTSTTTRDWVGGSNAGSTETITRVTTYTRNENGQITGITQRASGSRTWVENGGTTIYSLDEKAYVAKFAFDPKVGWYLAREAITWVDVTPPAPAHQDPAVTGNLTVIDGELYMFVNTITDLDGEYDGEGRVVRIEAAEGQEAEFEALMELVQSNGGSLEGYTIWGDYLGEGAADYTAHTFVFHGIGYGPFGQ